MKSLWTNRRYVAYQDENGIIHVLGCKSSKILFSTKNNDSARSFVNGISRQARLYGSETINEVWMNDYIKQWNEYREVGK